MSEKTFLHGKYAVTVRSTECSAGLWSSDICLQKNGSNVPVNISKSEDSVWQTDAEAMLAGIARGIVCVNWDNQSASD
jgi:hypothetical protein